ncbi:MAG: sulfatase, partial [Pirellulaceae bacterium]
MVFWKPLWAFCAAVFAFTSLGFASDRPNILFCIADDWGWPHAGAYGDPVVKTPAFDRLAREGVLFENAFVTAPSCTPCRNSILTGQWHWRLGQGGNLWSTLHPKHPVFPLLLEDAGYHVGHWRKAWGPGDWRALGRKRDPAGPTYKNFAAFLKARPDDRPFCFWLGTSDPHRPYPWQSGARSGIDIDKIKLPADLPNHETVRHDVADYYFEVQRFDRDVMAALTRLEQSDELDNTIVVMTGDHGMPFPRHKCQLYDSGTHVPLAIRWGAKVKGVRRVTDFVSLADVAPTFLEAAGVAIPKQMTGRSVLKVLESDRSGRVDPARDHVLTGRERHGQAQEKPNPGGYPMRAIRTD